MTEAKISDIGKYRVIELVGEGAMGVVYRAQDTVLDRTVAIKVMNESIARLQAKLDIIIDVLTGVAFAHKRGIVHRDIKPANIRVAEDGRAKIMDFGVAHLASSSMTSTGSILGTPTYMAPEQITEGKGISTTS